MGDFLQALENTWNSAIEHWLLLSTVTTCVLMAMFRTAKTEGKVDFLEAGMCGLFSYGVWLVLGHFNLPEGAGVLVGGICGYLGTATISKWVSDKLGITSSNDTRKDYTEEG